MKQGDLPAVTEHEAALTRDLVNRFENAPTSDGVPTLKVLRLALARRAVRIHGTQLAASQKLGVCPRTVARWLGNKVK